MAFNKKKKAEEAAEEKVNAEMAEPEMENEEQKEPPANTASEADPIAVLTAQLSAANEKTEEYLNMAQRVQADFDNYRRRNQNVRAEAFDDGAREFIKTLLPVMDNLERALQAESADEALHQGVEMVYRQLQQVLEKRGVSVIERLNEKFDPNLENAVMQGAEDEGEPGCVCAVLQKGYRLGDSVLRHAMVKVVPEN